MCEVIFHYNLYGYPCYSGSYTQFKVANLVSKKTAFPAKFTFQVSYCCSAEIQI